jgi:hypothetical protein
VIKASKLASTLTGASIKETTWYKTESPFGGDV